MRNGTPVKNRQEADGGNTSALLLHYIEAEQVSIDGVILYETKEIVDMIEVKKLVEKAEPQENREVTGADKYSIETSVAFWREYLRSPRPKRRRAKRTETKHVSDDGSI